MLIIPANCWLTAVPNSLLIDASWLGTRPWDCIQATR